MAAEKKINTGKSKPVVLLAPLDWGLGHTTRCIPIIAELLKLSCTVIVACNSVQKRLLASEFPQIQFEQLEGYNLRYSRSRLLTLASIVLQVPKILIAIKRESAWLNRFLSNNKVDAVISDNRYGFRSRTVKSVFITHQLNVKTGAGSIADHAVNKKLKGYIETFSECWVPDFADQPIAGELSKPQLMPAIPVKYLGCLSRFEACMRLPEESFILIILSGPEPQRSVLERIILKQVPQKGKRIFLVRGLPDGDISMDKISLIDGLEIAAHLNAKQLNELICKAELVISRAGYTTIMDLLKLKKKMMLIPTPGQKEQEYLAEHLQRKKLALCYQQQQFSLPDALSETEKFEFAFRDTDMNEYKIVIEQFVKTFNR